MRIVIIGRTDTLYNSIKYLNSKGNDIVLIITCSSDQGQYKRTDKDFKKISSDLGIDFIQTDNLDSIKSDIKKYNPDIGLSVNWKYLISQDIIKLFHKGVLNAHPGKLPRYRGNSARNWALINGEKKYSQTIHFMNESLDAGPILVQEDYEINIDTNIGNMYEKIAESTPLLFEKALKKLESGYKSKINDDKYALRGYPRIKEDSQICWEDSAEQINRLIKASSKPFHGAYTFFHTNFFRIWESDMEIPKFDFLATPGQIVEVRKKEKEVLVATGEDFLVIKKIEYRDSGIVEPNKIIKSIKTRLGMNVELEILKIREKLGLNDE